MGAAPRRTVLVLFGTRPEAIKLAPVVRALRAFSRLRVLHVSTAQHRDLLEGLLGPLEVHVDCDLDLMRPDQTPARLCARILAALDRLLEDDPPDLLLVQGDTTSAFAGALAAFYRGIPVGHVEAGLRSDDPASPFPEEMNRRLISRLADLHFAATAGNAARLRAEGVPEGRVFVTGNPIVDAISRVRDLLRRGEAEVAESPELAGLPEEARLVVLTTHRRESFGKPMRRNLEVLRAFVDRHEDVVLAFPVHPNPAVVEAARGILGGLPRIHLLRPLPYPDFLALLMRAWLVVSDSGGIQEEAPTLGVPVVVIRENTERPEAVESGWARLTWNDPDELRRVLEAHHAGAIPRPEPGSNPFGDGRAGRRIAEIVDRVLAQGCSGAVVP